MTDHTPRNLDEDPTRFVPLNLDKIEIAEWHPERDGRGRPTKVVVGLHAEQLPEFTFVLAFSGPHTLARVINALTEHGHNVFGTGLTGQLRRPGATP